MSSSQKNPTDVDVALSDLAAGTPPNAPGQSGAAANGGNGSRPVSSDRLMGSASEDPTPPPNPQDAPQPPAPPGPGAPQPPPLPVPQGAPQPPAAPGPQSPLQPSAAGQPPAAAPGYFEGQPPQPPPGYQGYPAYPPQPGGPYERRGLMQAWYEYPALRWLTVLLALAGVAVLVWLLAFKSDGSSSATVQPGGGPVGATEEDLVALSQRLNQPIYWAGNVSGTRMELTETSSSYAYLRYLPSDAPIGDSSPNFLTVGTYPSPNAYANLRDYANNSRAKTERLQNGGIAVVVPRSPTSVYFAFPHQDVQVEVYDPQPNRALDMVKSGQVHPVPGGVTTTSAGAAAVPAPVPGQTTPGSVTTPEVPTPSTTTPQATPPIPGG